MGKKVLIAAVAVVIALVVINSTRLGSHLRLWRQQAGVYLQKQVPPEQEIARLKMELENLARQDEQHFHKVATQIVEVENMKKEVAALVKQRDAREASILRMKAASKGEDKFITYADKKFSREEFTKDLRASARAFQTFEELVKSKEEQLALKEKSLETNREKLMELKLVREQYRTELSRLEAAIEQERQTQAAQDNTIDDAKYQSLRKEMNSVRDRIEVLKQKRILKGEVDTPVRAAEQKKEQDAAIDRYLDSRFSDKQDTGNKQ